MTCSFDMSHCRVLHNFMTDFDSTWLWLVWDVRSTCPLGDSGSIPTKHEVLQYCGIRIVYHLVVYIWFPMPFRMII